MLTLLANSPFHDHAPLCPTIVCCVITEGPDRDGQDVSALVFVLQSARYQQVSGYPARTRNAFEKFSTRKRGELMHSRRSVFVSATSKGFAWWRKAVADILGAQDIEPLEETWLTPEGEVVQSEIENLIRSATGVICLVGPYYGYPSEETLDGGRPLSYTQWEWCLATELNKPRLIYVIENSFFGEENIGPETDPKLPESFRFRGWQADFRQMIKADEKTYPHRCIESPQALGVALAMINWREWPSDG